MCLGVPGKVIKIMGDEGIVDFGGVKRKVVLALLEDVKEGDYVVVHAGFAIEKINMQEVKKLKEILEKF